MASKQNPLNPGSYEQGVIFSSDQDPASSGAIEAQPELQTIYHVDIRERAHLLHSALGNLANAAMSKGFDKAKHTQERKKLENRYKPVELESLESQATYSRTAQFKEAKDKFLVAYNLGREVAVDDKDVDFKHELTIFNNLYGIGGLQEGAKKRRKARDAYKKRLERLMAIPGPKIPYAEVPFEEESQPRSDFRALTAKKESAPKPYVSTAERLDLAESERSPFFGFYFATRKEKNVMTQTMRLGDRTRAIVKSQTAKHGEDAGRKTVVSLINEVIDLWHNADVSMSRLDRLARDEQPAIDSQTLIEAGYAALVRDLDLEELARSAEEPNLFKEPPFDALRATENRRDPQGSANKIIEDPYTGTFSSKDTIPYIEARAKSLSPAEISNAARTISRRQANRRLYWAKQIKQLKDEYPQEVDQALQRVAPRWER